MTSISGTTAAEVAVTTNHDLLFDNLKDIVRDKLAPLTTKIDQEGYYPVEVLRALGEAGAYRQHLASQNGHGGYDLVTALKAMDVVSRECMSTGFMMWAQDVLGWYVEMSDNAYLKETLLPRIASGEELGGTALSNPMKYLAGIEELLLSAEETEDGFIVSGTLPWVSNLGEGHWFGSIFKITNGDNPRDAMALINTSWEGLEMKRLVKFTGMEGTGTYSLHLKNVFVPKTHILGDPLVPYLKKMKAGFVLLQTGMATGLIEGCIGLCEDVEPKLGHVNCFLDDRPDELREELDDAREAINGLCEDVFNPDPEFMISVLETRLLGSELCLRASSSALQHTGANGYLIDAPAQRKVREAWFVAIVTPAIKHLRKELDAMAAA
ncbi:MAG: acyl-CoA/acyl-ACP dehydrogenase [Gammaproteobacteria bacterium]|nr:acyl-CoA/acyl-ACP dehydrogenase [Gammaproteobacteria bacterium]